MLISGLVSESGFTPGGNRTGTTDGGFTLTTTVGVITGVHYRTTNGRSPAHMTLTSGLTVVNVCVLGVRYLANGCHTLFGNVAELAGGKAEKRHSVFLCHKLSRVTCGTSELSALAGIKLYVMNNGTNGHMGKRKCVTGLDVGIGTAYYGIANLKANRCYDVALNAVFILNECDESRAVRIVLKGKNSSGNAKLVSLEIDYSVLSAVSAATMANGDSAVAIASGILLNRLEQASLGSHL